MGQSLPHFVNFCFSIQFFRCIVKCDINNLSDPAIHLFVFKFDI